MKISFVLTYMLETLNVFIDFAKNARLVAYSFF